MAASSSYAKLIRVNIELRAGAYFASSPDLEGFLVASPDRQKLDELIPRYMGDLYKAAGQPMVVTRIDDGTPDGEPWVALPLETARRAVEAATDG